MGKYSIGFASWNCIRCFNRRHFQTLVGTPPNLSFARIISIIFPEIPEISFADWFIFLHCLFQLFFFLFCLVALVGNLQAKIQVEKNLADKIFKEEYTILGKAKNPEERIVFILFIILALLWIFRKGLVIDEFSIPGWSFVVLKTPAYINDGTVAIFYWSAIVHYSFQIKKKEKRDYGLGKLQIKLPWHIVLLFRWWVCIG